MGLRDDERGILWESESSVRRELRQRLKRVPLIVEPKTRRGYRELRGIEAYKWDDAQCYNLIQKHAPYRYLDRTVGDGPVVGEKSVKAAGWSIVYLHSLISENKRPAHWIEQARTQVRTLSDYLLERQAGTGYTSSDVTDLIGTTATTDTEYGAFIVDESDETYFAAAYSEDVGVCGLALLRAYQLLGDPKYQTGYKGALTCLRRMQQGGKLSTYHAATSSGGGRYHSGMWTHKLTFYDEAAQGGGTETGLTLGNWRIANPDMFIAQGGGGLVEYAGGSDFGWEVPWDDLPGTMCKIRVGGYYTNATSPDQPGTKNTWRLRVGSTHDWSTQGTDGDEVWSYEAPVNVGTMNVSEGEPFAKPAFSSWLQFTVEPDAVDGTWRDARISSLVVQLIVW